MSPDRPDVSVVIVSYNTRAMTLDCLRTLFASLAGVTAEVWLVDNASSDGTVVAVRQEVPQVKVIANDRNLGFGAANNQALRRASGRYLLLLNSDAFPAPDAIRKLVTFL